MFNSLLSFTGRSKDIDKPPQIEEAPPQFQTINHQISINTELSEASKEEETKFEDKDNVDDEDDVFVDDLEQNEKENLNNQSVVLKSTADFGITEDQKSLDNNSLIDFEEINSTEDGT